MAIDKNKTKQLIEEIERFFDEIVPIKHKEVIKKAILGPAIEEIKKLVEESRPPVFYLIGRSGHGKSSLINALAGKKVAEVGNIKPTTFESTVYEITFPERYAVWRVIDSRGLFETTSPEGGAPADTIEKIKQDIKHYKPDIIIHVISAPEIRNLAKDLEVFDEIWKEIKSSEGIEVPVLIVLTKVDTLGNPREWPPEEYPKKAGLIGEALNYFIFEVLHNGLQVEYIDKNVPYKGLLLKYQEKMPYLAIIPVCALEEDRWNIENLAYVIGDYLPKSAHLDFVQAQRRKGLLKKISSNLINKFSVIAGGIGTTPIPVSDIFILTPLQILLIAIIGGLSCKPVSEETVTEYLTAAGINIGVGYGLRELARQLVKLIPGVGSIASGTIAALGTYAIGKAAELYFFEGIVKSPEEIKKDTKRLPNYLKLPSI